MLAFGWYEHSCWVFLFLSENFRKSSNSQDIDGGKWQYRRESRKRQKWRTNSTKNGETAIQMPPDFLNLQEALEPGALRKPLKIFSDFPEFPWLFPSSCKVLSQIESFYQIEYSFTQKRVLCYYCIGFLPFSKFPAPRCRRVSFPWRGKISPNFSCSFSKSSFSFLISKRFLEIQTLNTQHARMIRTVIHRLGFV